MVTNATLDSILPMKRLVEKLKESLNMPMCSSTVNETISSSLRPSSMQLKREIEQRIQDLQNKLQQVMEVIDHIENASEREVLIRWYIKGQDWLTIEEEMYFSLPHLYRLRNKAVASFSLAELIFGQGANTHD